MNAAADRPRRDLFAFDRSDGVGLTVLLVLAWVRGEALPVPYSSPVTVAGLDAVRQRHTEGRYDLLVADPSTAQRLLDLVPGALLATLVVAGTVVLLRVMRDIGAGEPFAPVNVTRLRVLAALLLLGVPLAELARTVGIGAILSGLELGPLPVTAEFTLPWAALVTGLVTALLAEAFRAGSQLRADLEGLV